jgi:sodium-dependent dicarboxylate transporter 2/3/5
MLMVALAAALLWMTEAVPLAVTSLIVILAVALLGILPVKEGLALVFHPVSAVVFAGFCLATSLQKYGLDRRLSLAMLLRMGDRTDRAVLGMMLATGLLSTMISNTAATAVMMVIALGVLRTAGATANNSNLGRAMLIGIPFAASIGGMGTPAGTPGNVITIALLRDMAGVSVSFLGWTILALPVMVLAMPVAWRLLVTMYPPEIKRLDLTECRRSLAAMGRFGPAEIRVAAIFGLTIALWAAEPFFKAPTDWTSLVGLLAAILLSLPRIGVLEWKDIHEHTGWNIFLLIGGGLAMGNGLVRTGAVAWLAKLLTSLVAAWPGWLVLSLLALATALAIVVFCTISGTATTMVPLAVGMALAAGWDPRTFAMVAGLSASFAFLLPANAAPNALAYGSGYFKSVEMLRAGIVLMGLCVIIVSLVANLIWPLLGTGA